MDIPKLELNSGSRIPMIGFGTWQLNPSEARLSVKEALKLGYQLIDTAKIYRNEQGVGEAIKESNVAREELFVTTKLWNSDQGYDSALKAFAQSRQELGLDYLDLYLIHWRGRDRQARLESWRALQEIQKQDLAKSVGVSNFEVHHLQEVIEASSIIPAVNQIEFNPFIYDRQAPILEFCAVHDIVVEAYSPLARGNRMDNPLLSQVAQAHNKTNAQVMLRWAVQHQTVPIPKSSHPHRIKQNLEVFDFELTDKEMQAINGLGNSKSSLPFLARLLK